MKSLGFVLVIVQLISANSVEKLGQAGQRLAQLPLQHEKKEENIVPEVQPHHFDLAISRLQSKTDEVISGVWNALDDKRQFVALSEQGTVVNRPVKFPFY